MKDNHRESLARQLMNFSAFRRKSRRDKKSPVDDIVISSPKLEESGQVNGITRIRTHDAPHSSRPHTHTTRLGRPASMVYTGAATRASRESLPDPALRTSVSTPALANSKPNVVRTQAALPPDREAKRGATARRVDSKIGQVDEISQTRASPKSNLDEFPVPRQPRSPLRTDPPAKTEGKRSSSAGTPSRVPTPPPSETASVRSPTSVQHSLHDKRYSQRLSLRSAVSFTSEGANDPYHILLPKKSRASETLDVQDGELPTTDDPKSFSIFRPVERTLGNGKYSLEERAERLLGADHLRVILDDPAYLALFSDFMRTCRPTRMGLLTFYWDAIKAIRAINYARSVVEQLSDKTLPDIEGFIKPVSLSVDEKLSEAASQAFAELIREDLPAYVCHIYTQMASASIERRICGALATRLQDASQGLAEVFVLTDPSQPNHPIVLASEEFALTTQYGLKYAIGRNSSFLQGPCTSKYSVRRLAIACAEAKEHTELLINYRRDGSPFFNLVMIAPLFDNHGQIRYWLGAQVDVSALLREGDAPESLQKLESGATVPEDGCKPAKVDRLQAMQALSVMLDGKEMQVVTQHGNHLTQASNHVQPEVAAPVSQEKPSRILLHEENQSLQDDDLNAKESISQEGQNLMSIIDNPHQLQGLYKHYLVVRPAPSLRILFASASLRLPGILQTHFLSRIGGNPKIKNDLEKSLRKGCAVTAKVQWLKTTSRTGDGSGRMRWVHCTPLLHHTGAVGLWMVVLVDVGDTPQTPMHAPIAAPAPGPTVAKTHARQTSLADRRMGLAELAQDDREKLLKKLDKDPVSRRPSTAQ